MERDIAFKILRGEPEPQSPRLYFDVKDLLDDFEKLNSALSMAISEGWLRPMPEAVVDDQRIELYDAWHDLPLMFYAEFHVLDHWTVALFIEYLRRLTRARPWVVVKFFDDGDLVNGHAVLIREGVCVPDAKYLKFRAANPQDDPEPQRAFLASRKRALAGEVFRSIPAASVAEKPEIAALGLTTQELGKLTVTEVVKQVPFSWLDDKAN